MAVSLSKGQKVSLSKNRESLSELKIGLGWDEKKAAKQEGGGFFKKLFSSFSQAEFDLDASVFMLEGDKLKNDKDIIYFGNLKSRCNSIRHQGDNTTGSGNGDDEVILVNLKQLPERYTKLVFVVNIYDAVKRNQNFGMISNCFIHIDDSTKRDELVRYNIDDDYADKTALIIATVSKEGGEWVFEATGEGTNDKTLHAMRSRY